MGLGISELARRCASCDERNDQPGPLCASCVEALECCPGCGQTTIERDGRFCPSCDPPPALEERAETIAPERLFEPAPEPIPGQITARWDNYA